MSPLDRARDVVAYHMDKIAQEFRSGAKITVLVRTPEGEKEPGAKDFMMTNDDLAEIKKMVSRRIEKVPA